jgi:hypothetical protein
VIEIHNFVIPAKTNLAGDFLGSGRPDPAKLDSQGAIRKKIRPPKAAQVFEERGAALLLAEDRSA